MSLQELRCCWPPQMQLGESPFWHAEQRALYWVDIVAAELHRLDPVDAAHSVVAFDESIGCIAHHASGGFVAGMRSGIWRLGESGEKIVCLVDNPENTADHRFNDGRCDPAGRFWLGTMDEAETTPDANLYCFDGGALRIHKPNLTVSNGLAFSPDGRYMYHSDSPRRLIHRHAYDRLSGEIGPAEVWVDLNALDIEGYPDGAAVDSEGFYWCALFAGAAIARFAPDGRLAGHYPLAARKPTMPAFGDADLRTLYVTTARRGMTAAKQARWPDSGSLFSMRVDVAGLPEPGFIPA